MWPDNFKTKSFSSYFISVALFLVRFSVILTALPFKIFFLYKNCIMDIALGKFNDNRLRSTSTMFFSQSMKSIYIIDWHFFLDFFFKDFCNNFVSIFFAAFFTPKILFMTIQTHSLFPQFHLKFLLHFLACKFVSLCPFYRLPSLQISH